MKASIETYHKEVPRIHSYHWGHQCFWFLYNRSLETYTCHICGKHMIGGKNYHKLKIKYHTKHVQMDLKEERSNLPSMDYILDNRFESVWSVYHLIYGEIGGRKGFSLMKKISLEKTHAQKQNKKTSRRSRNGCFIE